MNTCLRGMTALLVFFCSSQAIAAVEWRDMKAEHFIVYYKKAPMRFVESTLTRAEENYRRTATCLGFTRYKGWTWEGRAKIYIYDDAADYKASSGIGWSAGSVLTGSKTISSYPAAHGFFDSTLPHEIGHIIFRDFIGSEAVVPLWLEEGVAMYQEESGRWGADNDVRRAMAEEKFISLADLMHLELNGNSDPELVRIFYAEAASLVSYLINEGETYRFARFCRELKSGTRFEGALKKAYMKYQTIEAFETDWKDHLSHEEKARR
ncbi:MAG: peptidase MA family metallohydrolase [Candidatus Omnitrophota bacterium]